MELIADIVDFVQPHDDQLSRSEIDFKGEYIQLSQFGATLMGLDTPFDPKHRMRHEDFPSISPEMVAKFATSENMMKQAPIEKPIRSHTWTRQSEELGWLYSAEVSYRTKHDTLVTNCKLVTAELRHPMWYKNLDYENTSLYIPYSDTYLKSRDIQLLRMMLMGYTREQMADKLFVSVSAIDKKLKAFRSFETHRKIPFQKAMAESGLSTFILDCPDWFSSESHHYQEAIS